MERGVWKCQVSSLEEHLPFLFHLIQLQREELLKAQGVHNPLGVVAGAVDGVTTNIQLLTKL